jgi:hypothetical protein
MILVAGRYRFGTDGDPLTVSRRAIGPSIARQAGAATAEPLAVSRDAQRAGRTATERANSCGPAVAVLYNARGACIDRLGGL